VLLAWACSGGDDAGDLGAVPTLLTAPAPTSSTSSTSTTTTVAVTTGAPDPTSSTTVATTPTTTAATDATVTPSDPGSLPEATSNTSVAGSLDPAPTSSTTPATEATSTTADIEPPPPSLTSTVPIPTAAQPPDTLGGQEVDFLLAPRAIAGLQFGASRATVLDRMVDLLGDPLQVVTLPNCSGGPGTALQWFNASVIITDRGLAYYVVGMNLADYGVNPVPGWHTATGLRVGDDWVRLETVYPQQISYGTPTDLATPFTVTAGADSGLRGQLESDVVDSVASGAPVC
jgi:hypothetical protein